MRPFQIINNTIQSEKNRKTRHKVDKIYHQYDSTAHEFSNQSLLPKTYKRDTKIQENVSIIIKSTQFLLKTFPFDHSKKGLMIRYRNATKVQSMSKEKNWYITMQLIINFLSIIIIFSSKSTADNKKERHEKRQKI